MDNNIRYGKNNVKDTLLSKEVSKVYIQKGSRQGDMMDIIKERSIPYVYVDKMYLDKMTDFAVHQGIALMTSPIKLLDEEELIEKNKGLKNPLVIMLDEVQDPQNLGSIIRIADAFNINGIVFNKRRNVQITSTVSKVSTGAINYVDLVRANNLRQAINKFKKAGYFIAFLDMDGENEVNEYAYDIPLVVVVGGEDKGVSDSLKKECDLGITIRQDGHVNSLNVSSAVSILCYQKNISRLK